MKPQAPPQATPNDSDLQDITRILEKVRNGEPDAVENLIARVYVELRHSAQAIIRKEDPGHTLNATGLVHEAFLRLFRGEDLDFDNRRHFFGSAAIAMRRTLVDHYRRKHSVKRGAQEVIVPLDEAAQSVAQSFAVENLDLLALDEAMDRLEAVNPRQARVVELRFFAGLTTEETAELLEVSHITVSRDWQVARLRLRREMSQ